MDSPFFTAAALAAGRPGHRGLHDGPAGEAFFNTPLDLCENIDGSVIITEANGLRVFFPSSGVVGTVPTKGQLLSPCSPLVIDQGRALTYCDSGHNKINMVVQRQEADGSLVFDQDCSIAGTGRQGHEDGPADKASFSKPCSLALLPDGSLLCADRGNHAIRRIAGRKGKAGLFVSTVVGGPGKDGFRDGDRQSAKLHSPCALHVDPFGTVLFIDGHSIRCLHPPADGGYEGTGWAVTTLAGCGPAAGYVGGSAYCSRWRSPCRLAAGPAGSVLVSDSGNHAVRAICSGGWLGPRTGTFLASAVGGRGGEAGGALAAASSEGGGGARESAGSARASQGMQGAARGGARSLSALPTDAPSAAPMRFGRFSPGSTEGATQRSASPGKRGGSSPLSSLVPSEKPVGMRGYVDAVVSPGDSSAAAAAGAGARAVGTGRSPLSEGGAIQGRTPSSRDSISASRDRQGSHLPPTAPSPAAASEPTEKVVVLRVGSVRNTGMQGQHAGSHRTIVFPPHLLPAVQPHAEEGGDDAVAPPAVSSGRPHSHSSRAGYGHSTSSSTTTKAATAAAAAEAQLLDGGGGASFTAPAASSSSSSSSPFDLASQASVHLVPYSDPLAILAVHQRYSRVVTVAGPSPVTVHTAVKSALDQLISAAAANPSALKGAPLPKDKEGLLRSAEDAVLKGFDRHADGIALTEGCFCSPAGMLYLPPGSRQMLGSTAGGGAAAAAARLQQERAAYAGSAAAASTNATLSAASAVLVADSRSHCIRVLLNSDALAAANAAFEAATGTASSSSARLVPLGASTARFAPFLQSCIQVSRAQASTGALPVSLQKSALAASLCTEAFQAELRLNQSLQALEEDMGRKSGPPGAAAAGAGVRTGGRDSDDNDDDYEDDGSSMGGAGAAVTVAGGIASSVKAAGRGEEAGRRTELGAAAHSPSRTSAALLQALSPRTASALRRALHGQQAEERGSGREARETVTAGASQSDAAAGALAAGTAASGRASIKGGPQSTASARPSLLRPYQAATAASSHRKAAIAGKKEDSEAGAVETAPLRSGSANISSAAVAGGASTRTSLGGRPGLQGRGKSSSSSTAAADKSTAAAPPSAPSAPSRKDPGSWRESGRDAAPKTQQSYSPVEDGGARATSTAANAAGRAQFSAFPPSSAAAAAAAAFPSSPQEYDEALHGLESAQEWNLYLPAVSPPSAATHSRHQAAGQGHAAQGHAEMRQQLHSQGHASSAAHASVAAASAAAPAYREPVASAAGPGPAVKSISLLDESDEEEGAREDEPQLPFSSTYPFPIESYQHQHGGLPYPQYADEREAQLQEAIAGLQPFLHSASTSYPREEMHAAPRSVRSEASRSQSRASATGSPQSPLARFQEQLGGPTRAKVVLAGWQSSRDVSAQEDADLQGQVLRSVLTAAARARAAGAGEGEAGSSTARSESRERAREVEGAAAAFGLPQGYAGKFQAQKAAAAAAAGSGGMGVAAQRSRSRGRDNGAQEAQAAADSAAAAASSAVPAPHVALTTADPQLINARFTRHTAASAAHVRSSRDVDLAHRRGSGAARAGAGTGSGRSSSRGRAAAGLRSDAFVLAGKERERQRSSSRGREKERAARADIRSVLGPPSTRGIPKNIPAFVNAERVMMRASEHLMREQQELLLQEQEQLELVRLAAEEQRRESEEQQQWEEMQQSNPFEMTYGEQKQGQMPGVPAHTHGTSHQQQQQQQQQKRHVHDHHAAEQQHQQHPSFCSPSSSFPLNSPQPAEAIARHPAVAQLSGTPSSKQQQEQTQQVLREKARPLPPLPPASTRVSSSSNKISVESAAGAAAAAQGRGGIPSAAAAGFGSPGQDSPGNALSLSALHSSPSALEAAAAAQAQLFNDAYLDESLLNATARSMGGPVPEMQSLEGHGDGAGLGEQGSASELGMYQQGQRRVGEEDGDDEDAAGALELPEEDDLTGAGHSYAGQYGHTTTTASAAGGRGEDWPPVDSLYAEGDAGHHHQYHQQQQQLRERGQQQAEYGTAESFEEQEEEEEEEQQQGDASFTSKGLWDSIYGQGQDQQQEQEQEGQAYEERGGGQGGEQGRGEEEHGGSAAFEDTQHATMSRGEMLAHWQDIVEQDDDAEAEAQQTFQHQMQMQMQKQQQQQQQYDYQYEQPQEQAFFHQEASAHPQQRFQQGWEYAVGEAGHGGGVEGLEEEDDERAGAYEQPLEDEEQQHMLAYGGYTSAELEEAMAHQASASAAAGGSTALSEEDQQLLRSLQGMSPEALNEVRSALFRSSAHHYQPQAGGR